MIVTPEGSVMPLVTASALTVGMEQPADEVRAAMNRRGVRFAAVSQGGRITAVLDRRTLNRRLAVSGRRLRVRDVVHPGMACLRQDASVAAAARLMRITGSAAVPRKVTVARPMVASRRTGWTTPEPSDAASAVKLDVASSTFKGSLR